MSFSSMTRLMLCTALTVALTACSAETTLKRLADKFPQRKAEFNELKELMLSLSGSAKDFRLLSAELARGSEDFVDFFGKEGQIPVTEALERTFSSRREQLMRVQAIVHDARVDYVSVDKERIAVWVTLKGGGVLGSDMGYLYAGKGDIGAFHLSRVLSIPNERNWYAFD